MAALRGRFLFAGVFCWPQTRVPERADTNLEVAFSAWLDDKTQQPKAEQKVSRHQ
jgi:hypothetical protein